MFCLPDKSSMKGLAIEFKLAFLSSGLGASMPTHVGLSVCLSLEKMSKIVKNQEFGLHLKIKVVDLLE